MVDETHPVRAEFVDETQSAETAVVIQEEAQEDADKLLTPSINSIEDRDEAPPITFPCLNVIGPRHPTLFASDIDRTNILPFGKRPRVLVTSANNC
ncbi:hypothetical protein O181_010553 [Austropuccinia psidii MF-1]|uniref:Uncharacterized protein n=1 Tax=Austropuccinia psidii MF-1 TaxID=1389203 RepID=A0A9Q3BT80_9BASI|nr:hypothetical protein [Austropuccinia psidii MF-1]